MLNAAYGRFALIQESEIVILDTDEDGDLLWWSTLTVSPNDGYLPLAIFTTAYARRHLMDRVREVAAVLQEREAAKGNIINGFNRIIHSDTDSVIYQGEPIGGTGKNLGMWDLESRPSYIYEGGFKRYIEVIGDELDSMQNFSMACAGVPQSLTFDGVPKGMWLELLDDPQIITQHHVLGQESYRVKSPWLRRIIANSGRNPDRMNTLKLIPVKVPGGVILQGRQHELSDGLNIRLFRCL